MKMVKSLLLGSAAGLVALTGAQAADLPVKAKPVQYVKICSLYGVGFYYIPGTDMCLKVGGWVRAQYMFGIDNGTNGPLAQSATANVTGVAATPGAGGTYNRADAGEFLWRARAYATFDARHQTAYGTARAYLALGKSGDMSQGAGGGTFSSNRAFIQWAGFTFGLASSFYDYYSGPAVSYYGGQIIPASDTGDGGNWVGAYTAQFGGGFSASIAAEDDRQNRATAIWNPINNASLAGLVVPATNAYAAESWPDVVGNLRLDQTWGGVQVMGAIHNVNAQYNGAPTTVAGTQHAGDKTGYAVGVGVRLNAPTIGKGDFFQAQFNYTEGALGYVFAGAGNAGYGSYRGGGGFGYGMKLDAVVSGTAAVSNLELTTAWGVNASYEHNWNDQWKTSVYGVYDEVTYNATANAIMCLNQSTPASMIGFTTSLAAVNPLCNNSWSMYSIGSRTQWNITKAFYMGVDVVYQHLNTASAGLAGNMIPAAGLLQPSGVRTIGDQDAWIGYFRVHYDFYP